MSPDLPAALPANMVTEAGRAILDHWCSIHNHRAGWYWVCRCKSGRSHTAETDWQTCAEEVAAHQARAVLAAALAECEVREEWRAEWHPADDEVIVSSRYITRAAAEQHAASHPGGQVAHRVVAYSPWRPVASPVDTPREDTSQ